MKKTFFLMSISVLAMCMFTSCQNDSGNEPTSNSKKTNCQISYQTDVDAVSSSEVPYNGELTDSKIMSIYNMALSTYGDRGLYHYVTFSDAKTESEIKAIAIEFGKTADNMVRSQYKIPDDVWNGYTKLIFKVNYTYDGRIEQVSTYDYLK